MNVNVDEKWINTDEAAEFFGVKPATIREWIKKDESFPAKKVGKCWKFKKSELDQWMSAKEQNV